MAPNYNCNLEKIRSLLIEGFTDRELRDFCFDTPNFKLIYHELAEDSGKAKIVSRLLEYAERKLLIDQLLTWAKEKNPARYEYYQPYYKDALATFPLAKRTDEETSNIHPQIIITDDTVPARGGYRKQIEAFLIQYLGTETHPVPFGGRDAALQELNTWLNDASTPPYLLLTAPAGRGKSALLVRWRSELIKREGVTVIFVPISIRFSTNLPRVFYAALTAQLARFHGKKIPTYGNISAEEWREQATDYLTRPIPKGQQLVVILDGLDEADGNSWPGPGFFPYHPPDGLRLVVSARNLAGYANSSAWIRRLGWEDRRQTQSIDLAKLTQSGVADVLNKMGSPLDQLGARIDIVQKLHYLSESDTVLVRLHVDDLWQKGETAVRLQPEDLEQIKPGYEGYFACWWDDQHKLWGDKDPLKEKAVREVLSLLAAAFGPLLTSDLIKLGSTETHLDPITLDEALRPLARFVIGDGQAQGYIFSHPKLGDYFYRKYVFSVAKQWEARFLNWGKETLTALREESLNPEQTPPYLLQYYSSHLKRSNAPLTDYQQLLNYGWAQAWEAFEGTYSGFLNDIQTVWDKASEINQQALDKGEQAPHLGTEIRCALCQVSVGTLVTRVPPGLLTRFIDTGYWAIAQGLAYARQIPYPIRKTNALQSLIPYLPDEEKQNVWSEVIDAAYAIGDKFPDYSAEKLAEIATHLPHKQQEAIWKDIIKIVGTIESDWQKSSALSRIISTSPGLFIKRLLNLALKIEQDSSKARALAAIAPYLPEKDQSRIWEKAFKLAASKGQDWIWIELIPGQEEQLPIDLAEELLNYANSLTNVEDRLEAFVALALHLPTSKQEKILQEVLDTVSSIDDHFMRAAVLIKVTPLLPLQQKRLVWKDALNIIAHRINNNSDSDSDDIFDVIVKIFFITLKEVIDDIPAIILDNMVRSISNRNERFEVITLLAPYFSEEKKINLWQEVFNYLHTTTTFNPYFLGQIVSTLSPKEETKVWTEVIDYLASFPGSEPLYEDSSHKWEQVNMLDIICPHLPSTFFERVLNITRSIDDEWHQKVALVAIAPYLPTDTPIEIWQTIIKTIKKIITWSDGLAETLQGIAPHIPDGLFAEVLDMVNSIDDAHHLAQTLTAMAPYLPKKLLPYALTMANNINGGWKFSAQIGIIQYLPKEKQLEEWGKILIGIYSESSNIYRYSHLEDIIPCLPQELVKDTLLIAREIKETDDRAKALCVIAPKLIEGEQISIWREVLDLLQKVDYVSESIEIIETLVSHLPTDKCIEIWQKSLDIVSSYKYEHYWDKKKALNLIIPHLPLSLLEEALIISPIGFYDLEVLKTVILRLPTDKQNNFWGEVLKFGRLYGNSEKQIEYLIAVAPHLPEKEQKDVWQETLLLIRSYCEHKEKQIEYLIAVAPHLPKKKQKDVWQEALRLTRSYQDDTKYYYLFSQKLSKAEYLAIIAPNLPLKQQVSVWKEVLAAINEFKYASVKLKLLKKIIAQLPRELIPEALAVADAIDFVDQNDQKFANLASKTKEKVEGLSIVAPYLPIEEQKDVWHRILTNDSVIGEQIGYLELLHKIVCQLITLPRQDIYNFWAETLSYLANRQTRPIFLRGLQSLAPMIDYLGGKQASVETAETVITVSQWWP